MLRQKHPAQLKASSCNTKKQQDIQFRSSAKDRGDHALTLHHDLIKDCRCARDGSLASAGNLVRTGARSKFLISLVPYHIPPTVEAVVRISVIKDRVSVLKCLNAPSWLFLSASVSAGCVMKSSEGIHLNVNLAL